VRVLRQVAAGLVRLAGHPLLALELFPLLAEVERARTTSSPRDAVESARRRGRAGLRRGPAARARLKRLIGSVDALFPSGPNCYRRALLETALDRGAAEEQIHFALDVGKTGHAWLDSDPERQQFDVVFSV
jgi:hypothetical protein